jgi:hypothetical protein
VAVVLAGTGGSREDRDEIESAVASRPFILQARVLMYGGTCTSMYCTGAA